MGTITRNRGNEELFTPKPAPLGKKLCEVATIAENLEAVELGTFLFRRLGTFNLRS